MNVDKNLGSEMKSTGEAIYFIKDLRTRSFGRCMGSRVCI